MGRGLTGLASLGGVVAGLLGCGKAMQPASDAADGNVLGHTVVRIDGTSESMADYAGRVLLIVNVASECGYTPQYEGLEALYQSRKDGGLVVMGFPSNDFLGQEPGSNEEIAAFCGSRFGVSFPMFEKIDVKGEDAHPLFRQLTDAAGAPSWNFNKYLIDRAGNVVARYGSSVKPRDERLVAEVDRLLSERG